MQGSVENYRKIYRMLEDQESKDTYLGRLAYLISGNYQYIENILRAYLPDLPLLGARVKAFLNTLPQDREIVLYGAGKKAAKVLEYFVDDRRFVGFCSNNTLKQANGYLGYPVMSPERLLDRKDVLVLICAPSALEEIMRLLKEGGYPQEAVFNLDAVSMAIDPRQYFGLDFIPYEEDEVYVDAGCYDLGDAFRLQKFCKHLKRVYAFEPDPKNYRVCLERKEKGGLSGIELFPFGTWSEKTDLTFSAKGNTSSKVSGSGEASIAVVPIDAMIHPEDRVTFIKMDVEGAELESLKGAENTIRRDRPKLAVCIYHKPEDMVEIPLFIKELVPEYKLYVRMHANEGSETVLYAIP